MILALVLLSALLHATWNALLRLERDKDRSLVIAIIVATLFATVIATVRWGLGAVPFATLGGLGFTILAGVFEAMYFVTLAKAMSRGKLGLVYTISRGGAVLVVWPMSIAVFAEVATLPAIAGSVVVLGGLTLCGFGAGNKPGGENQPGAIAWALACAASIAGYHLAYKAALGCGVNPSASFALSLGVSAVINVLRLGASERRLLGPLLRVRGPRLIVMGLVCAGSFLLLMEALAIGGSGYVLTLRNTSLLFAAGMAWWIGERPSRSELAG
ncbi:MAG: permease, partial [Myxococcales bacterium]|nr:permease [Myxococcales bacterium]